ncbi:hypothetical protein TKWG_14850 [Advenella kashmirensis WT001]|uniref:Polyketide cyclase n=1 Tax=Advenella kashmirensis (strain DSM 17095 / LMG 22695 / WT001) TaxID=1036672 RepID=I3UDC4_ADVKW|nr:nuclear transport factor 2 family protein [Advenella kashmirensis]AFK63012.1 hypothetical protein TKWG_14850 [Advenella kashmirensis WT001]
MPIHLPEPIQAYFDADKDNGKALADCFTEQGIVIDEKHTYNGRAAIERWRAEATAKYEYTSEPFDVTEQDRQIIVTSRLQGNFPGSPIHIRYRFVLENNKIASLEITP